MVCTKAGARESSRLWSASVCPAAQCTGDTTRGNRARTIAALTTPSASAIHFHPIPVRVYLLRISSEQRSPPSSYLIHHLVKYYLIIVFILSLRQRKRTLFVVLLVPELAACQSALTSPSTLRGVRIHRCQALKATYTFCCGPEGWRSLKHLTVYFVNCSKHIHTRPREFR